MTLGQSTINSQVIRSSPFHLDHFNAGDVESSQTRVARPLRTTWPLLVVGFHQTTSPLFLQPTIRLVRSPFGRFCSLLNRKLQIHRQSTDHPDPVLSLEALRPTLDLIVLIGPAEIEERRETRLWFQS